MKTIDKLIEMLATGSGEKTIAGPFELASYPCADGFAPEAPQNPCAALVFKTRGRIGVKFAAAGRMPKNAAKTDNEKTWLTGDVVEFFVMKEGCDDYHEFHATPEGRGLQLHLPHYKQLGKVPFEKLVCDCGLEVKTHELTGDLWVGEMNVEIGKLGNWGIGELGNWGIGELGNWEIAELRKCGNAKLRKCGNAEKNPTISKFRFCVSRYYYRNTRDIEFSSYPPLPPRGYHNPPRWEKI